MINWISPIMKPVGLMKENNIISSINQNGSLLLSSKRIQMRMIVLAYKYSQDIIKYPKDKKYEKDA